MDFKDGITKIGLTSKNKCFILREERTPVLDKKEIANGKRRKTESIRCGDQPD